MGILLLGGEQGSQAMETRRLRMYLLRMLHISIYIASIGSSIASVAILVVESAIRQLWLGGPICDRGTRSSRVVGGGGLRRGRRGNGDSF